MLEEVLAEAEPVWSLPGDEALEGLAGDERGLAESEALERLARYGSNELEAARGAGVLSVLLHQFRSPLIYILLLAALVTVVLREFIDAAVIGAVLVLNAALGFSQEFKAERSMAALRSLARGRARVLRDGRERELDARELVPGDIVLVEAGAKVPADSRILHAVALEADESLLTGESVTVAKSSEPVAPDAVLGDRTNMLYTGTVVTRGHCRALVVATGAVTELGRIAGSVQALGETETPLQRRMTRFAQLIGVAVLAAAALGLGAGALAGDDLHELFLTVVALAVSAIPEGLPIVLTLVLAIAARRMAARHVIIRRLAAVETLGSCTVIGSDKTGTLTENRMTVQRILAGGSEYSVTGAGYEVAGELGEHGGPAAAEGGSPLQLVLLAGALCNDASAVPADGKFDVAGDPTEIALLVAAAKAGLFKNELEERYVRVAEIPFDSERRLATTFNELDGRVFAFVKGAPEELLRHCSRQIQGGQLDREAVLAAAEQEAERGLRVLAVAYRELEGSADAHALAAEGAVEALVFLGLQAMIDPPREAAAEAIRRCQAAGIRVLMITGDHARTGAAIARQLGIAGAGAGAITGVELDRMSEEELRAAVRRCSVFARVSPEHKLRIVTALRELGETVAVTGDGVNDAPALKAADIGAAMGLSGTDVAKEAADMVVTDDNFANIVAAVEEGRIAFDNVRKTTFFLVSSGAATVAAVLVSIVFRFQLPFLPAQLLWLNLVTNGVQDVALAFEPGAKDVLRRPPRPRGEGVISRLLWERTALVGAVMAAGTLALFLLELDRSDDLGRARTVALTTMVLFQVFHAGNSRSEHLSVFATSRLSNPFLLVGTAIALAIHVGALHLPFTQYVLRVEPLDILTWIEMVAVASTIIVAVELHKLLRGPRGALRDSTRAAGDVQPGRALASPGSGPAT